MKYYSQYSHFFHFRSYPLEYLQFTTSYGKTSSSLSFVVAIFSNPKNSKWNPKVTFNYFYSKNFQKILPMLNCKDSLNMVHVPYRHNRTSTTKETQLYICKMIYNFIVTFCFFVSKILGNAQSTPTAHYRITDFGKDAFQKAS